MLNLKSSTFRKIKNKKNLISNKELEKHINPFAHVQCIHKDRELINSKYMNHETRTVHEQCINSTVCTKADIWVGWRVTIYYELREEYYTSSFVNDSLKLREECSSSSFINDSMQEKTSGIFQPRIG